MITGLDHVQIAMPAGREDAARAFYAGLLGMIELEKPPVLAARGGCWFGSGAAVLHLGVEASFAPARKAHPALLVDDLDGLAATLTAARPSRSSTSSAGCALRAGANDASTPRCRTAAPERNQQPPRAERIGGFGSSLIPSSPL